MRFAWPGIAARALILCGVMTPLSGGALRAAESPAVAPGSSEALRFRRVYAPADQLKDWPRGDVRYVPMDKTEFERLVELARWKSGFPKGVVPQAIVAARYSARLAGDSLVDGEAVLDVVPPTAGPGEVRLDPCGLAIGQAAWMGENAPPAVLALAPDGALRVRAERAGQLRLAWSLRGQGSASGCVDFLLDLPACPASQLSLVLPKGLTPLVERAVVAREDPARETGIPWAIDLGGQSRVPLRVVPSEDLDPRRRLNGVRQSVTYGFSLQGVELSAEWTLDVPSVPLRQLTAELDPGLQLVAARLAGQPVSWSTVAPGGEGRRTRAILSLPEPILGSGRVLSLTAAAPLKLSGPWRLPTIQPQGLFWQEGAATLTIFKPLTLQQLSIRGGRQTQTGPLPGPQSGELAEVHLYSASADIEVELAKPEPPPQFDCGSAVELSAVDMAADVLAHFRLAEGERFRLEADVSRRWTIDSVETVPADALDDWVLQKSEGGGSRLTIRLAKALSPSRPVSVAVRGRHHYSPLGRVLSRSDLLPVEFRSAIGDRRLVSLRAAEAYQLWLADTERLTRVGPADLGPGDLALFEDPPKGLVFLDDAQAASLRVALEPQKPSYTAEVQVEATATDAGWVESYVVRCTPEAARVDRLLVRFSRQRPVPLRWSFGAEDQEQIVVRPWKPRGRSAGRGEDPGEAVEIVFRRARSVPFELRASRTLPMASSESLGFVSLPEAAGQRGTLLVGSTSTAALDIQTRGLTPIAPPAMPEYYRTVRAAYRYDPAEAVAPGSETSAVLLRGETGSGAPWAWAWSCRLESHFRPDGTADHRATYWLENAGRDRIGMTLPERLTTQDVRGVCVDGTRVAWEAEDPANGRSLAVALRAGQRFPVVSIDLRTSGPRLGIGRLVEPALPQLDVPVLKASWTAWLAPGYQAGSACPAQQWPRAPALSISQRLFGPLGRPAHSPRFRPSVADDWSRWADQWRQNARARRNAERFLQRLGAAEGPASPPVCWAEKLFDAAVSLEEIIPLVDRGPLRRAGLTGRTPVPSLSGVLPGEAGRTLAQQAGLALLICNPVLLVTTADQAALHRSSLVPAGPDNVWQVLPGPLAEHLIQAGENGDDPSLVPLETWSVLPREADLPWPPAEAGASPAETLGWTACRLELPSDQTTRLAVVHRDSLKALGWTVFLGVFAALVWKGRRRPATLVVIAGLWAVAAIVVPEAMCPLCSGGFLGTLAAIALYWIKATKVLRRANADSTVTTRHRAEVVMAVRAEVILVAIGAVWAFSAAARGGEPPAAPAPPSPAVHQVFIPIDEKQQPVGDKYYVAETLFSRLQAMAPNPWEESRGCLIQSAVYRGTLRARAAPEGLALADFRASFDLEVIGRQVHVQIPLGRDGVEPLPDGITLEGRPIQPVWPDEDGALAFEVAEPGKYRLELALKAKAEGSGAGSLFDMRIPRLAGARLELSVPTDAPEIEFPSALGSVVREPDPARVVVRLGPTDRLQIHWPDAAQAGDRPLVDVEQLLWLKFQPGSVVLDAQLSFKVLQGRVREVRLATDPRLQLFPGKSDPALVAQVSVSAGDPQLVRFELSRPVSDRLVLPVTFVLRGASGMGNYRLPLLEPIGARTTRRWLAVGADPALEPTPHEDKRLPSVAVPAFQAAWGGTRQAPLWVWELPSPRPNWSLSTRPVPARVTAEQRLLWSFGARTARALLEATVVSPPGAIFQYHVAAPPELEVERISVLQEGVEQLARWSQAADGTITVFLSRAALGKQQLKLQALLPIPETGKLALPMLRLEAEPTKPMEIAMLREPGIRLEVGEAVGLVESEPPPVEDTQGPSARLVRAFRMQSSGPVEAGLTISPNRPVVRADQITTLRNDAGAWEGETEFRLQVAGGFVDEFHLQLPAPWAGPYRVDPPATLTAEEIPGQGGHRLAVRPRFAVEGEYRLKLSTPLTLAGAEPPSVGSIVAEGVSVGKHLVVLPKASQGLRGTWETRGLTPADATQDSAVPAEQGGAAVAYQVVAEPYRAVLRAGEDSGTAPQVPFADVRIDWQADGSLAGVAAFDLEPAGIASCPVSLPPSCRLVQVFVDGQPALSAPTAEREWQVALHSTALPQRIEVLFARPSSQRGAGGLEDVAAPGLGDIPVRRSVWAISAASGGPLTPGENGEKLSPLQYAVARLRSLTSMLERVAELPAAGPEELASWFRPWARQWMAGRAAVRRELALAQVSPEAATVQAELGPLENRWTAAADRLKLSAVFAQLAAEPLGNGDPDALWQAAEEPSRWVTYYQADQLPQPIAALSDPPPDSPLAPRLLAALGLAVATLAAGWGVRRRGLLRALRRVPYGAGVIVGLVWWWWLSASMLGWFLLLASLAAGAWSFRHRRKSVASAAHLATF